MRDASSSDKSWRSESRSRSFHTRLHSLYSSGVTARTRRRYARRSSAWVRPQTYRRLSWRQFRVQSGDGRARVVTRVPIQSTRDTVHRPKSFSSANAWFASATANLSHRPGLDRLAVQDGGTGFRRMTIGLTQLFTQGIVNAFPGSLQTPLAKVSIDGLPRRQVVGQVTPLTSGASYIQNRIDNFATGVLGRTITLLDWRDQRFKDVPFVIG